MAVHSVVEFLLEPVTPYDRRLQVIKFVSNLYIATLNAYFSSGSDVEHRTLTGLVNEPRASVFDPNQLSLRGLLAQSVKELNESQWVFFRYAILEIIHSKHAYEALLNGLNTASDPSLAEAYRSYLPNMIDSILGLREQYIAAAVQTSLNSTESKQEIQLLKARLTGEGKSETEIAQIIKARTDSREKEVRDKCKQNITASLGEFAKADRILSRLSVTVPPGEETEETFQYE